MRTRVNLYISIYYVVINTFPRSILLQYYLLTPAKCRALVNPAKAIEVRRKEDNKLIYPPITRFSAEYLIYLFD